MIRVHAAVERNINSAVERINKFQILKYKFPVSEKLIPGFFKKVVKFVKNFPIFLKDIKVFLTHTVAQACTYICVSPHVYMHRATRTYA